MKTEQLLNALQRPVYVWRQANAKNPDLDGTPMQRGAYVTAKKAMAEIEALLAEWQATK